MKSAIMNLLTSLIAMAMPLATATAAATLAGNIVCPADAPAKVKLAAKEIRRYIYLCGRGSSGRSRQIPGRLGCG